jgi:hypothetical protein
LAAVRSWSGGSFVQLYGELKGEVGRIRNRSNGSNDPNDPNDPNE